MAIGSRVQELPATVAGRASIADFFSHGFRPFFLGAAVYACLLMSIWLAFLASTQMGFDGAWLNVPGSPFAWHAHELAVGFIAAAIGGFLLTAVPNWTGALPFSGRPLGALFALWVGGRLAMLLSPWLPAGAVAIADLIFLPVLGGVAVRQLLVKPAMRNFLLIVLLASIVFANVIYHLSVLELLRADALAAMRAIILVVSVMIAMIGGRIIPAFTHNWLNVNRHGDALPRRLPALDAASVISVAVFALVEVVQPGSVASGAVAAVAAAVNALRLQGWRGWAARPEPIIWVLHAGYAWLVAGLALAAISALTGHVAPSLAYHALGAGSAGTMILAVMTRASLGHTGRKLLAPPLIVWSYWLMTLAAALRVFAPIIFESPAATGIALTIAALAWIAAFGLFVVVYTPILTTPRVRNKLAA